MPNTPILTLRFPDGDVEHRTTRGELPIGSLVRTRGSLWRVRSYSGGTAYLDAADHPESAGAAAGPVIIPRTLGDTPLTLEIVAEA
jgi:hypothetical protein